MSEPARAQDNKKMLIDLKDLDHKVSWKNFFLGGRRDWGGVTAVAAFFITNLSVFFPLIAHTGGKRRRRKNPISQGVHLQLLRACSSISRAQLRWKREKNKTFSSSSFGEVYCFQPTPKTKKSIDIGYGNDRHVFQFSVKRAFTSKRKNPNDTNAQMLHGCRFYSRPESRTNNDACTGLSCQR